MKSTKRKRYIQTILSQAKRKLSLTDKDLVGICWSTFYREDKFIKGEWRTPGNIFNIGNKIFSQDYYDNHVDVEGMTMRDCAIIDTVTQSLKREKFDSFGLMGVGLNGQGYYAGRPPEETFPLQTLYNNLDTMQPCLWTYNECQWPVHYTYKSIHDGKDFPDYHPSSPIYRNWLKHIGFPMGADSKNYAEFCDDIMKQTTLELILKISREYSKGVISRKEVSKIDKRCSMMPKWRSDVTSSCSYIHGAMASL